VSDPLAQTADARPPLAEWAGRLSGRPVAEVAAAAGADQAARWHAGERVPAEDYLAALPALAGSPEEALVLIVGEVLLRRERGERPGLAEYAARFPHLADRLAVQFEVEDALADQTLPTAAVAGPGPPSVPGYEVLGEIGRGGMGVVYRARQFHLNRVVALKTLPDRADTADAIRFLAEAEAVAAVHHPHVVQVFDFGQHDGRPYFAMEFLPGGSLRDRLGGRGTLPPVEAATLVARVARGVQAAHDQQIVHRDLKPANILFDVGGEPKVADFGLARRGTGAGLTRTRAVMGTPAYMSPEQAKGDTKFVGPTADVYALGAVLYECLTGVVPFPGDDVLVVLRQVAEDDPQPPRRRNPAVPRDLELVGLKCLRKDPADRYPTAGALADDLTRFAAGEPVTARRTPVREQMWRWVRRNKRLAGLLALIVLASVSAAVVFAIQGERLRSALQASEDDREKLTISQREAELRRLDSMIAEARGTTLGRRPGQRFESLRRLDAATALARELGVLPDKSAELRNAFAAALAAPDLELVTTWPAGFPQGSELYDFSGDHSVYARTHADGTCVVVRVVDNVEVCRVPSPPAAPGTSRVPLLSGDGQTLLVYSLGGEAHVWRVGPAPGPPVVVPNVFSADLRRDGRRAAFVHTDGLPSVLDLPGGQPTRFPHQRAAMVGGCVLHPTKPWVAQWSDTNGVVIRDTGTGRVAARFPDYKATAADWHPHEPKLAVATTPGSIRVVRPGIAVRSLRGTEDQTFWETAAWPTADVLSRVQFNPAGDRLAGVSWSGTTFLIDAQTGRTIHIGPPFLDGTTLRWSPDGRRLAGPVSDTRLGIWEVGDGREFRVLQRLPATLNYSRTALHPRGRLVAAGTGTGVTLWDVGTGRQIDDLPQQGNPNPVFDAEGTLWTHSDAETLRWRLRESAGQPGKFSAGPPEVAIRPACGLACDADGRVWVGVLRTRPDAFVWRPDRPNEFGSLPTGGDIGYVDVSPDGNWAVTVEHTFVYADLWDLRTGKHDRRLYTRSGGALPAFSPDGKWLWVNTDGGRLLHVGSWEPGPVTGRGEGRPAFTRDGRLMALETGRGSVRLIDTESGRELVRLDNPHQDALGALVFTPDADRLIGCSLGPNARGVHVWDLRLIRRQLADRGLDWKDLPLPDPPAPTGPVEVFIPIRTPIRLPAAK
jgi:WD40 repeat protein